MEVVTEAMIIEAYSQEPETPALLVTLTADGLADALRFSNQPGGLFSLGEEYRFLPFGFRWGGASTSEASRDATLELGNDGRIAEAVRTAPAGTQILVTVEVVRVDAPDEVERTLKGARSVSANMSGASVTFTLRSRDFDGEMACGPRYVQARTPGLFA